MDINNYSPFREGTQYIFISSENRCEHIGNNEKHHSIRHFRIDGDVFPPNSREERCDYLLLNDTDKRAYYIELKGSDIKKAMRQIDNSIRLLHDSIHSYSLHPRIIYYSSTHEIHSNEVTKWKIKHLGKAIIRSRRYEESIS